MKGKRLVRGPCSGEPQVVLATVASMVAEPAPVNAVLTVLIVALVAYLWRSGEDRPTGGQVDSLSTRGETALRSVS